MHFNRATLKFWPRDLLTCPDYFRCANSNFSTQPLPVIDRDQIQPLFPLPPHHGDHVIWEQSIVINNKLLTSGVTLKSISNASDILTRSLEWLSNGKNWYQTSLWKKLLRTSWKITRGPSTTEQKLHLVVH